MLRAEKKGEVSVSHLSGRACMGCLGEGRISHGEYCVLRVRSPCDLSYLTAIISRACVSETGPG